MPVGLARLEPAAVHEHLRAYRRHRALHPHARLSEDQRRGPALFPPAQGTAHLRARARYRFLEMGAWIESMPARAGCSRNCASCSSCPWLPARTPLLMQGFTPAPFVVRNIDPGFALIWAIGIALRHRRGLPGEVPPAGGAHSARRRRARHLHHFIWLSAPDLAVTQLLVEIVTTCSSCSGFAGCRNGSKPMSRPT